MSDWQKRALEAELVLAEVRQYAEVLHAEKMKLTDRVHELVQSNLAAQTAAVERTTASMIEVAKHATHVGCMIGIRAAADSISDAETRESVRKLWTEIETFCAPAFAQHRKFIDQIVALSALAAAPTTPAAEAPAETPK